MQLHINPIIIKVWAGILPTGTLNTQVLRFGMRLVEGKFRIAIILFFFKDQQMVYNLVLSSLS